MYDIKQFRPALYIVILIGITGYAIASESAALWVLALAFIFTNIWLIAQGQFKPIPRLLANTISMLFLAYAVVQVHNHEGSPILAVGQFLVLLQVVKLWEQRANRDYAQLLVLSLLLMVAAAISTDRLSFGILFIGYLFLSLYCCLLFHLKVETDQAKSSLEPASARWGDAALKHDQKYLSRSMRRLTGLVAVYAIAFAVIVFLFFPRGSGAGMFGQFQWRPRNTLTGFSEQVGFQQIARITQNDDIVGTLKVWRDEQIQNFHGPLLLRGVTHDYYNGNDDSNGAQYQWTHAPQSSDSNHPEDMIEDNGSWYPKDLGRDPTHRDNADDARPGVNYQQEIELNPTGTTVLFAMAGVIRVMPGELGNLRRLALSFNRADQTVRASDVLRQPVKYQVMSTGTLGNQPAPSHTISRIDPKITEFARKTEVTGDLAALRDAQVAARKDKGLFFTSPLDEQIAEHIERYLRNHYAYTLDLTDTSRISGQDPMVAFLYDFKRGHCEYFAGAMTLLCQSLGLNARLVVGFKCDDYNDFGHFYTVRQSQAHAWVEVLTAQGWKTYDPTSGNGVSVATVSAWQKTKHFFDFMEYTWQNAVISYNADNRDNLINAMDTKLSQTAAHSANDYYGIKEKLERLGNTLATEVVGPLVGLLTFAIVGALGWFCYERLRLRRRAKRIGIKDLPLSDQAKLVRQLGFYDDLLRLLERNNIARPRHLTPMEFSSTLSFLPSGAYSTIRRLTQLFYKIRYGGAELDDGQRRRLGIVVERLSRNIIPVNAER